MRTAAGAGSGLTLRRPIEREVLGATTPQVLTHSLIFAADGWQLYFRDSLVWKRTCEYVAHPSGVAHCGPFVHALTVLV